MPNQIQADELNVIYRLADKCSALLNKKAIIRFRYARDKARREKWDESDIIAICEDLYSKMDSDNRKAFLELAQAAYEETIPHGKEKPTGRFIAAFLNEFNPVTKYVYAHEVDRKRSYAAEGVISSKTIQEKNKAFEKALRLWSGMSTQYADEVTDQSMLKAYEDAGIEKVRWITERDEKVCPICAPRDGKVYNIKEAPPKAHWRCRCWYKAVLNE